MSGFEIAVGVSIVILLFGIFLVAIFYFRRQAVALEETRDIELKRYMLAVKRQRAQEKTKKLTGGAHGWLADQIQEEFGLSLSLDEDKTITLESLPVLVAYSADGDPIVISPMQHRRLRKKLKDLTKKSSRLNEMPDEHTALALLKKVKRVAERSLANAGEYFDIQAKQAGDELKTGWGQPDILYVMLPAA